MAMPGKRQTRVYCSREACVEKARGLLGSDYVTFGRTMLDAPMDFWRNAYAASAAELASVLTKAHRALKMARIPGPIVPPSGVTQDECIAWRDAVSTARTALGAAVSKTPAPLRRPKRSLARQRKGMLLHRAKPSHGGLGIEDGEGRRLVPAPVAFARALLARQGNLTRDPRTWAYAAIALGLSDPIDASGDPDEVVVRWRALVAEWRRAIERATAQV